MFYIGGTTRPDMAAGEKGEKTQLRLRHPKKFKLLFIIRKTSNIINHPKKINY